MRRLPGGARPRWAARALGLAVLLAVGGCAGGDDGGTAGGADDLPGAVPEGVAFRKAPEGAVPAPEFTPELLDGTRVAASELWDDRPVVLLFTASWCETCADLHRTVADEVEEHDGAIGLLALVREDDAEGAREYADELEVDHPVGIVTDRVWLDYAVREPPLVALVAPGGEVVRGWPGGVDADAFAQALDGLYENSAAADG